MRATVARGDDDQKNTGQDDPSPSRRDRASRRTAADEAAKGADTGGKAAGVRAGVRSATEG